MRIGVADLAKQLERKLAPMYLLYGEEPLLLQEGADALRAACRARGYSERRIFDADASFDWNLLLAECSSLSLFAEQKLIEIRLPGGKPGSEGATVLRAIAARPPPDTVLLLLAGKIDWSAEKSAWFKAIDEAGVAVKAWPVRRNELPGWIGKRLREAGFRPDAGAVALLAERVEGNLLAAQQEIEKLGLLAEPGALDARSLAALVTDSARYSSFDLCDRALEGARAAAIRTLQGLRAEGEEIQMVLGALAAEIRRLMRVAQRHASGESMDQAVRAERGRPHYAVAVRRLGARGMHELLHRAALVDRCIKGLEPRDAWTEMLGLVIQAAGGIERNPAPRTH